MRKGHTLIELVIVLVLVGTLALVGTPVTRHFLDWVATDGAAHDVTVALATAREAAVGLGQVTRVRIAADSLVIDRRDSGAWVPWRRLPGPSRRGVGLQVSNSEVVFSPLGSGWGASNTTVTLTRGETTERITTSRVGRVKRW